MIKTAGVAEVLARALLALKDRIDVAFIFGSAAKARLRPESDIDLFVIGSANTNRARTRLAHCLA